MDFNIDWQISKTLPERMKYMLDSELMCDVTFRVGPDQTPIKAHKYMLASASPVFYSMFEGPMAEKGEVVIPDITSESFKVFLEFIYTDDVQVNANNVKDLMYSSEKYLLQVLKEKCSTFLSSNINAENACLVLVVAYDLHIDDLQTKTLTYILKNAQKCLNTDNFLSLTADCLKIIIQSDELQLKEDGVYDRTIEWARKCCKEKHLSITDNNIRNELGDLLFLIRFPVMKPEYFTDKISNLKLLTSDEKVSIYQSFYTKTSDLFPTKARGNYLEKSTEFQRCAVDKSLSWNHTGNDDCIDFRTNFRGVLSAIAVFGSKDYSASHIVKIDILKEAVILGTTEMTLCCTAGHELYRIPLAHPIEIEEKCTYSIKMNMIGPSVFHGTDYSTYVIIDGMSITFLRSSLPSSNGTSPTTGQIPGLVFDPQK